MEPRLPQNQGVGAKNIPIPPASSKKGFFFLLFGICLLLLILLFFALSRFQLLPQIFKNQIDPTSTIQEKLTFAPPLLTLPSSFDPKVQEVPLFCPLPPSICQDKSSFKDGSLDIKVKKGVSIKAAFSGEALTTHSFHPNEDGTQEQFSLIILTNKEKGLVAYYSLKGQQVQKREVKEGEEIAITSGEPIVFKGGGSFFFELEKIELSSTKREALSSQNFKL